MTTSGDSGRGSWASGAGFVLAAAGSAVGLGNVWRFPYITGENGGGLFVVVYLASIALVGLPIMVAEILIGRAARRSTVSAFKRLAGARSPWQGLGWLGVVAAFAILSFYAVVAGWALHYAWLAGRGGLAGLGPGEIAALFGGLRASPALNLLWLVVFMALTVSVVVLGVRKGLDRWSRILMPAFFVLLAGLLVRALTLDGFPRALGFVFGLHAERLTAGGVLEALGHSFFTLSLGMGGLLTYGSYLDSDDDVPRDAVTIAGLDTAIALLACLVIFPIIFTYELAPGQGPGLVFTTLPVAFARMPAGTLLATVFFVLLVFAALTSAISLLEVATAFFIDERGWPRRRAALVSGAAITLLAVPSALTGSSPLLGPRLEALAGRNWFDLVADLSTNWLLPCGGLGMAVFVAWRLGEPERRAQFAAGSRLGAGYAGWLAVLRYFVPLAVGAVFLHAVGLF